MKFSKIIMKKVLQVFFLSVVFIGTASAKLSDTVGKSTQSEASWFLNFFMWVMMFVGIVLLAVAITRWVKRSDDRNNPITWEYKGMLAGLVLIGLGWFAGEGFESLTGTKANLTTDGASYQADFQ